MSGRFTVPPEITAAQRRASSPDRSAWVAANAGSGKTHVLTERVIRLMLAGSEPSRLICLTFTKAAAATMSNRVFARLAGWATASDADLDDDLARLEGRPATAATRLRARRLFAAAIETPGGLKIQTIHAFCEAVLHRFPLEAELAGGFEVLDDLTGAELAGRARDQVLARAGADGGGPLGRALATAMAALGEARISAALDTFLAARGWLADLVAAHGDLEMAIRRLGDRLSLEPGDDVAALEARMLASPFRAALDVAGLVAELAQGGSNDQAAAARFVAALDPPAGADTAAAAEAWLAVFFVKDGRGEARKKAAATKAIHARFPALQDAFDAEAARLAPLRQRRDAAAALAVTAAVARLGAAAATAYEAMKRARGRLDFADLIQRTAHLLSRQDAALWVQYKLDAGIDHILVDEAQDTSPEQWRIVSALADDFFSGVSARGTLRSDRPRTLFAVGDDKQSIYSFQGARPEIFAERERAFARAAAGVGLAFEHVPLKYSFRSTQDVLSAVDAVFAGTPAGEGVSAGDWQGHLAVRAGAPGEVEIWPAETVADDGGEPEDWLAPLDAPDALSPVVRVATRVADAVDRLLADPAPLPATGRPARPRDILILVRRRGPFVEAVNRLLKERGRPVAGSDRLKLFRHIAVLDLLALARAALLPEDDLSLAAVLKSPLFGLAEDDLADLAIGRDAFETLHAALLRAEAPVVRAAAARFAVCRARALTARAFEFFAAVLAEGGRRAFRARLGDEADEVLDEFLAAVLTAEAVDGGSLTAFVAAAAAGDRDIKREVDDGRDEIRVMTVHGAKGLEAPVVFLVDGAGNPAHAGHDPRLLEIPADVAGAPPFFLWLPKTDAMPPLAAAARDAARARAAEEHRRLLYVAMTRAADRLIVAAYAGKRGVDAASWIETVRTALEPTARVETAPDGGVARLLWRADGRPYPAGVAPTDAGEGTAAAAAPPPPDWLFSAGPVAPAPAGPLSPSRLDGDEAVRPPPALAVDARDPALRRGRAIHRLLQLLPDVAAADRAAIGRAVVAREAADLDAGAVVAEVLALLADPRVAACFAPGSRAEVPILGRLRWRGDDRLVSGRVDRLMVTADRVTVVDFKTDRVVPAAVPPAYRDQLALYAALLAEVYPGRTIAAAVVWTAGPRLDLLAPDALTAAGRD
jgi:ATP-dependent helicase/nuclease subunit A